MWNFLKKDILVLLRDRTELAVLLLMPLILTAILGFALGSVMGGSTESIEAKIAIVQEDQVEEGSERFVNELEGLPTQAIDELSEAAQTFNPTSIIESAIMGTDIYQISDLSKEEAETALSDEEVVAILTIPKDFTYQTLNKLLLNQGSGGELVIKSGDHSAFTSTIFQDVIELIVAQLNLTSAVEKVAAESGVSIEYETSSTKIGGTENVTDRPTMSALKYYTFAMAVMFALYIASTIATKAFNENSNHTFSRIILAGRSPIKYLSGKGISSSILVMIQLAILLMVSVFVYQSFNFISVVDMLGIALITFVFALSVGAIGILLTSIVMSTNSVNVAGFFSGAVVSVFAFLGGSFVPKTQLPDIINSIGNWTPNGLALTAYLQWSQGLGFEYIATPLIKIFIISLVITFISIVIYPRKRVV
ncbi:ABC transporter permease [Piscibacillus sp. B03]|uniref:ABC transporter permease n=1 Tax=Piscibacillus sp. B03 TaxID=3457430 RepID=UPI003FCCE20A